MPIERRLIVHVIGIQLHLTIVFYFFGHVVIHHMLDGGEIKTFGGHICGHQDIFLAFFERFYGFGSFLLI